MLTIKQQELLLYIHSRVAKDGVSPSFEEMKEAVGIRSKSGIHRMITALEERGFIRRLRYRARALEILKMPPDPRDQRAIPASVSTMLSARPPASNDNAVVVKLYGRIAAGTPIEALSDVTGEVEIPARIVGSKNCYALEIEGDSMIDAGILDGDTVIIEYAETAENGTIVVALIDGIEVTLKRLRQSGQTTLLEASNPAYRTKQYESDRVSVQGRLVGLLRLY